LCLKSLVIGALKKPRQLFDNDGGVEHMRFFSQERQLCGAALWHKSCQFLST
jgi:hypothetical protein